MYLDLVLFSFYFSFLFIERAVKGDRAVLLINLCSALLVAYVLFLVGVDRTENQVK